MQYFYRLLCFIANIGGLKNMKRVSGKLPPRKTTPQLGLGLGLGLGLQLGLGAIFLRGNCPRTYENVVL